MQNIKRAAKGPREDQLTVASNNAVDGNTLGTLEDPIRDIFAGAGPEETETDTVKGLVDTHMAGTGGSVIRGENITPETEWYNNEHEQLRVVLNRLKDNKLALV